MERIQEYHSQANGETYTTETYSRRQEAQALDLKKYTGLVSEKKQCLQETEGH